MTKQILFFFVFFCLSNLAFAELKTPQIPDEILKERSDKAEKALAEFLKNIDQKNDEKAISMIKKDKSFLNAKYKGTHILLYAIENDREKLAADLIKNGSNLNEMDSQRKTPLIYAVEKKNKYLAILILNGHADVNIKDKNGKTALDYAENLHANDLVGIIKKFDSKQEK